MRTAHSSLLAARRVLHYPPTQGRILLYAHRAFFTTRRRRVLHYPPTQGRILLYAHPRILHYSPLGEQISAPERGARAQAGVSEHRERGPCIEYRINKAPWNGVTEKPVLTKSLTLVF